MKAHTFILTITLTMIGTLAFAQNHTETNPLDTKAVRTLASWYSSNPLDENGRLRDYTPTDDQLGPNIFSDAYQPSVQQDLQQIVDMMPCEEGQEWKLQQAVADAEAMAAVEKIDVSIRGENNLRAATEDEKNGIARGVGSITCTHPETGVWANSSATVSGSRMTLVGSGHYLEVDDKPYFKREHCVFRIFDEKGYRIFESALASDYIDGQEAAFGLEKLVPKSVMPKEPLETVALSREEILKVKDIKLVGHPLLGVKNPRQTHIADKCEIIGGKIDEPYYHHDCDETGGSSGGAFIGNYNGKTVIVGVDVGEFPSVNLGTAMRSTVLAKLAEKIKLAQAKTRNTGNL